jgi:hypothetical protein
MHRGYGYAKRIRYALRCGTLRDGTRPLEWRGLHLREPSARYGQTALLGKWRTGALVAPGLSWSITGISGIEINSIMNYTYFSIIFSLSIAIKTNKL